MTTQFRKPLTPIIAVLLAAAMFFAVNRIGFVAPQQFEASDGSFRYTLQDQRNGSVYVNVNWVSDDQSSRERYRNANNQRLLRLLQSNSSVATANGNVERPATLTPIPIQITFVRPISIENVRTLVKGAGISVSSFALVGHSSISGTKGVHVEFGDIDKLVPANINVDPSKTTGEQLVLSGVMVLQGHIQDLAKLAQLATDERIYLLDTTEVEVRTALAERHASLFSGKEFAVSVPSPFWELDW